MKHMAKFLRLGVKVLLIILSAAVTVVAFFETIEWQRGLDLLIEIFGLTFVRVMIAFVICAFLWLTTSAAVALWFGLRDFREHFFDVCKKRGRLPTYFVVGLVPVLLNLLVVWNVMPTSGLDQVAECVFRQVAWYKTVFSRNFSTNGMSRTVSVEVDQNRRPEVCFVKVALQVFPEEDEVGYGDAGWSVIFENGRDFSSFSSMEFYLKTAGSSEGLAVRLEDASGHTELLEIQDRHLAAQPAEQDGWFLVRVPFDEFRRVDFGRLDSLGIVLDSRLSSLLSVTLQVGGFSFQRG